MTVPAVNPNEVYLPAVLTQLNFQSGTATLASGTVTVTGVKLNSTSMILVTMRDQGAGALTAFADFRVPVASRTATQFVVDAINASSAVLTTAVCTIDWMIIG